MAFLAESADAKETNACPRILRFLCATTSRTSPYVLKSPRNDVFMTKIMIHQVVNVYKKA